MTACANCSRALQPAWKYCIYCGTRTSVVAAASRSRPLPSPAVKERPPLVTVEAPAPLAAAPSVSPISSVWPESMGERPSLRSALAATDTPAPTPPVVEAPAPEVDPEPHAAEVADEVADANADTEAADTEAVDTASVAATTVAATTAAATPQSAPAATPPATKKPAHTPPAQKRKVKPKGKPSRAEPVPVEEQAEAEQVDADAGADPLAEVKPAREAKREPATAVKTKAPPEPKPKPVPKPRPAPQAKPTPQAKPKPVASDELEPTFNESTYERNQRADRTGRVNMLAVLALLLGVLASPLAALFGHIALGQLRVTGERGVIPSWIAIVLGYLWLGFFLVLGITYLATNG